MNTTIKERNHFIDWVRVLAFFLLIIFHCAMPFVIFGWEIKNPEQSMGLSRLIWWLHQWRIPLLFFVSGVGIHYSLAKRPLLHFAGERVVRLFIPLLFAMFFTIPAQVYFEWLQQGKISMSYASFYPTVWDMVPYPGGSLTWSHMWFVVYLFVFCLLLLPVFGLFKIPLLAKGRTWLGARLAHPAGSILLALPLMLWYFTLYLDYPEQQSLLDDWFLFLFCLTMLLYGYLLSATDRFWNTCMQYRYPYLGIAVGCAIVLFVAYWWNMDLPKTPGTRLYVYSILNSIHVWFLVMAILGFAKRHLNFSNRFLVYTNKAVYPFYILHQTLIVAAGYYIVQWPLPIWLKFLLLVTTCLMVLPLLYHWLIRPFMLTRVLFGLKPTEEKRTPS